MYSVSQNYRDAIKKRVVEDRISGKITLSDGTSLTLSDKILVKNSLKISHELCGDYRIGTFHIGCLQIAVFDDNALLRDFSGAKITPVYEIKTVAGWETVPMGIYLTDGNSVRRRRNTISLTAYDYGCLFDRTIPESRRALSGTAQFMAASACADCGVSFGGIQAGLPNETVKGSAASPQIQTYRDLIAWCAELLCGYAVIDREGKLWIRSAKYSVSETDSTDIVIDKYLTAEERDSIYVTDTRAYIRTIHAFRGGVLKTYHSDVVQPDEQAAPAAYTFSANPLLPVSISGEEMDRINTDRLAFIDGFKQRGINAELYGDPALDVGDVLRCSGGDVDQRRSIVGLVTKQEWRYRNFHTVICAAPPLLGQDAQSSGTVRSQTEKRIDAIRDYAGGKGIEVSGSTIKLKPAKTGWSGEKDNIIGGVWTDGYGLRIEDDGRIHLKPAGVNDIGGVSVKDGLRVSTEGRLSVDPGKGMMFYTVDSAPSASTHLVLSPRLGDGLRMEPEEPEEADGSENHSEQEKSEAAIQINAGEGLEFGEREYFNYRYAGIEKTGYTSKLRVKLGKGLSFGANGEINAAGGGNEYKAGENITISDDGTISAQVKEYKAGKNITILDDGTIDAEGGSGVSIDQAVIIKEADAKYLLHSFTEVEYDAGNQIGYAGPGNQIVVGGRVAYASNTLGGSGSTIGIWYDESAYNTYLSGKSRYMDLSNFRFYMDSKNTSYAGIKMVLKTVSASGTDYEFLGIKDDGTTQYLGGTNTKRTGPSAGILISWGTIHAPEYVYNNITYEFGAVTAGLWFIGNSSTYGDYCYRTKIGSGDITIPFASLDEYNAAVGLTYEPLTLTRVEDNPTVVNGKEATEWIQA